MARKVLLVCHDFPPNQGIGGRRWAKFAKGLAAKDVQVFVLKARPIEQNVASPWSQDVEHPLINIEEFRRTYPEEVSHPKKGLIQKFKYRSAIKKLMSTVKGTIYDIAVYGKEAVQTEAARIIVENDIEHVIVTGAPFNLFHYIAELKTQMPELKILVDYRDPWITAKNYGMANLDESRMLFEKEKQQYIFENVDFVSCPNEFLLKEIRDTALSPDKIKAEFISLPHSYDPYDIAPLSTSSADSAIPTTVYGGAIYVGLNTILDQVHDWLKKLRSTNAELAGQVKMEFYTPDHKALDEYTSDPGFVAHPSVGKKLFDRIGSAHTAAIFLSDHNKDFLTTKFFEILPLQKPMLVFGPRGHAADFVEENSLGKYIGDFQTFEKVLSDIHNGEFMVPNYDFTQHSLPTVTQSLMSRFL